MIVVVGVSHHTAPIELRERAALGSEAEEQLLADLSADPRVAELFVVSTCNRVELVAAPVGNSAEASLLCVAACRDALLARTPSLAGHLYEYSGTEGLRHLLRVAASLDSLVMGEPQILGQLKQGFERARSRGTVGPLLHRVFAHAARGAKRVRSETQIGSGQVSVPSIAIDLARQIFGDLAGHRAALVGSGEMAEGVARLLVDAGAELTLVGRNAARLEELAREFGAQTRDLSELSQVLATADVVVTSTSASEPIVRREQVAAQRRARKGRNLFFIDLAVPRDVEADVGSLDGVFLYNIDDLSGVALESTEERKKEAERAGSMIEESIVEFERRRSGEQATPVIKALRSKLKSALDQELEKSLRGRLSGLDSDERKALEKMLEASLNRMLHQPTVFLRERAMATSGPDSDEVLRALSQAFELDEARESIVASGPRLDGDVEEPRELSLPHQENGR